MQNFPSFQTHIWLTNTFKFFFFLWSLLCFTIKWHPSRHGFFYFSFNNGSLKTCQGSQKLAVKVTSAPAPESSTIAPKLPPMAAPVPTSGGVVSSSPAYPWPFRPKEAASPAPEPSARSPAVMPSLVPDKGGGLPFINSNPAVPLPTGEVDSATIRPLPMSSHVAKVLIFHSEI